MAVGVDERLGRSASLPDPVDEVLVRILHHERLRARPPLVRVLARVATDGRPDEEERETCREGTMKMEEEEEGEEEEEIESI